MTATIHHAPISDFELSEVAACAGTQIVLIDGSMYADEVTLDWGEGDVESTNSVTTHEFDNPYQEPLVMEIVQTARTAYVGDTNYCCAGYGGAGGY